MSYRVLGLVQMPICPSCLPDGPGHYECPIGAAPIRPGLMRIRVMAAVGCCRRGRALRIESFRAALRRHGLTHRGRREGRRARGGVEGLAGENWDWRLATWAPLGDPMSMVVEHRGAGTNGKPRTQRDTVLRSSTRRAVCPPGGPWVDGSITA